MVGDGYREAYEALKREHGLDDEAAQEIVFYKLQFDPTMFGAITPRG